MADEDLRDVDLARRTASGDMAAFHQLYLRHRARALGVARKVVNDRDRAEDATSEAFVRMLRDLTTGKLSPEVPFVAYLLTVTRNVAIDQLRLYSRFTGVDEGIEPAVQCLEPDELLVATEGVDVVLRLMRSLPSRWQMVLWLTQVEELPARDVGRRMGLSANSAAQLARRARLGLRELYRREVAS